MLSRATLAAIIVAIFVVGAATAPPVSAASTRDAGSLLTQAQISAELGVSVEAGDHVVASAPGLCGWAPPGGPTYNPTRRSGVFVRVAEYAGHRV
jgi:hypothetical protein